MRRDLISCAESGERSHREYVAKKPPLKFVRSTIGRWLSRYPPGPVCRSPRHRVWSRRGIEACCCRIWTSISITWALCRLPRCLRTQINSSAKHWPIHLKASTTDVARPKSCGAMTVLFIHSFAHGRAIYLLRHDARSAKAAIAQAPVDGLIDYAMAILATTEMEPDELEDFVATVAKAAGIGVRAVRARIAKERREREQAKRKTALASGGDGRLIRPRPAARRRAAANDEVSR